MQGLIRRIGTGEDTEVWNMNCIPRAGMMRPVCCVNNVAPIKVQELINPALMTWDLEPLKLNFLPIDWEVIMSIPLSSRRQEDFWAWHYEKSGVFSVRSTYRMLVDNRERRTDWIDHNPGRSDLRADQKEWTELWNIKVPSKVRVFLWRLARQSMPTGDVRQKRNMAQHSNCTICGNQDFWRHALLECNMARCVWALQGEVILDFLAQAQHIDARGWLHDAVATLQHKDVVQLVVTMWAIWYARRKAIHEG